MSFTSGQQWVLVGMIIYPLGCINPGCSSIHSRVSAFLDWFRSMNVTGTFTANVITTSTSTTTTTTATPTTTASATIPVFSHTLGAVSILLFIITHTHSDLLMWASHHLSASHRRSLLQVSSIYPLLSFDVSQASVSQQLSFFFCFLIWNKSFNWSTTVIPCEERKENRTWKSSSLPSLIDLESDKIHRSRRQITVDQNVSDVAWSCLSWPTVSDRISHYKCEASMRNTFQHVTIKKRNENNDHGGEEKQFHFFFHLLRVFVFIPANIEGRMSSAFSSTELLHFYGETLALKLPSKGSLSNDRSTEGILISLGFNPSVSIVRPWRVSAPDTGWVSVRTNSVVFTAVYKEAPKKYQQSSTFLYDVRHSAQIDNQCYSTPRIDYLASLAITTNILLIIRACLQIEVESSSGFHDARVPFGCAEQACLLLSHASIPSL